MEPNYAEALHDSPDYPMPCLQMRALLQDAVDAWPEFETDEEINGGDAVQWLGEYIANIKATLTRLGVLDGMDHEGKVSR